MGKLGACPTFTGTRCALGWWEGWIFGREEDSVVKLPCMTHVLQLTSVYSPKHIFLLALRLARGLVQSIPQDRVLLLQASQLGAGAVLKLFLKSPNLEEQGRQYTGTPPMACWAQDYGNSFPFFKKSHTETMFFLSHLYTVAKAWLSTDMPFCPQTPCPLKASSLFITSFTVLVITKRRAQNKACEKGGGHSRPHRETTEQGENL